MTILNTKQAKTGQRRRLPAARVALAAGMLLSLLAPAQAQAFGGGWQPGYQRLPVRHRAPVYVPQQRVIYDDPNMNAYGGQRVVYGVDQRARRCNQGRLVGGLMGGGAGYVLAKGNDRVWATPLGALLGSQMGCNAVQGNAPLPW
ncbi:MAG: glycine zipper 2TM domain-containing protein [Prochlorococcaceae cyanobacterium]